MIEPSIALYGEAFKQAARILARMLEDTGARYALLVDRKGFVLAHQESLWAPPPPDLDSIATLVAGNAAATRALAELLGEERFAEILHQGKEQGLYVEEIDDNAILVVIFDPSAPVGRIKIEGKKSAQALKKILAEAAADTAAERKKLGLDTEYRESAAALLDDLFGEA